MSANEALDQLISEVTPSPMDDPSWSGGAEDDGGAEALAAEHDRFDKMFEHAGFGFGGEDPTDPTGEQPGQVDRLLEAHQRVQQDPQAAYAAQQQQQQALYEVQQREAQLRQAYAQQLQALQQQAQQPAVDWDSDPQAYVKAREAQFAQELQQIRGELQQRQQIEQVQQHIGNLAQHATQAETEFRKTAHDYDAALEHSVKSAQAELRQRYPGATDQQIEQASSWAMAQFVEAELSQGRNPAQSLYEGARKRGFKPTPKLSAYERQLEQASKIGNMSPDEFESFWNKMTAAERPRLR